jgi:hypothetical protein
MWELEQACVRRVLSDAFLALEEAAAPDDTDLYMELVESKSVACALQCVPRAGRSCSSR